MSRCPLCRKVNDLDMRRIKSKRLKCGICECEFSEGCVEIETGLFVETLKLERIGNERIKIDRTVYNAQLL